ncbi:MAG: dihydrodipicolinate synthase family protein [Thermoguttaceae bacterium]
MSSKLAQLHGIIPAMITPLSDYDTLDCAGLERLIEHLIQGGVHGIFLLGSCGEGPSLSYHLRRELIKRATRLINNRVPVLVGITDTSFPESMGIADHCAKCGADAVVLAPPYYFNPTDAEMLDYIKKVAATVSLPLVLYNMPGFTKHNLALDTVRRAVELKNVVAMKDSSCDMNYFAELCKILVPMNFPLFIGPEEKTPDAIALGARGAVCGGANFDPKLFVDYYNAAVAKDTAKVAECQKRVDQLAETIYQVGNYGLAMVKGTKCALNLMGICEDAVTEPFQKHGPKERAIVEDYLKKMGYIR